MNILAPAKLNLYLEVGKKRADGYHVVQTVMQTVGLYDEIRIAAAEGDIAFKCDWSGVKSAGGVFPADKDANIAYKAALELKNHLKETRGARIEIKKRIPVGAGLGGGSSDAAAVMKGLLGLWGKKAGKNELKKISLKLGADVNFFRTGGCCLAEGIGADITPLSPGWKKNPLWAVLVNPGIFVPTVKIYDTLVGAGSMDKGILRKARELDAKNLNWLMFNRLEDAAFRLHPELNSIKKRLVSPGCLGTLMSGSGSTLYVLFDKKDNAERAFERIKKEFKLCWLVKTVG